MDAAPLDIEDRAACERYLVAAGHALPGDVVEHKLLAGGVSGRTVLVAFADGRRWVLKQALAKLRVKADWFSDPNRIHREALGMRVLGELAPPGSIPKLIFDDAAHHVIGMEAVPEPHENWKTMLLAGRIEPKHANLFGKLLGMIHASSSLRFDQLSSSFSERCFFESLRIEPYYVYSASMEPRATAFLEQLIDDTRSTRIRLVHGDFSPKNILIHDGRLVLLDHEVIHWGDPGFDVGFALAHILSKSHHLSSYRSTFVEMAHRFMVEYYIAVKGIEETLPYEKSCVRHALGCLLARVIGRSPLEYLNPVERDRQRKVVVRLMQDAPQDVPELIERFTQDIAHS